MSQIKIKALQPKYFYRYFIDFHIVIGLFSYTDILNSNCTVDNFWAQGLKV